MTYRPRALWRREWDKVLHDGTEDLGPQPVLEATWLFELRDCWLGWYWDWAHEWCDLYPGCQGCLDVYVCVVPCFPLHLRWHITGHWHWWVWHRHTGVHEPRGWLTGGWHGHVAFRHHHA